MMPGVRWRSGRGLVAFRVFGRARVGVLILCLLRLLRRLRLWSGGVVGVRVRRRIRGRCVFGRRWSILLNMARHSCRPRALSGRRTGICIFVVMVINVCCYSVPRGQRCICYAVYKNTPTVTPIFNTHLYSVSIQPTAA